MVEGSRTKTWPSPSARKAQLPDRHRAGVVEDGEQVSRTVPSNGLVIAFDPPQVNDWTERSMVARQVGDVAGVPVADLERPLVGLEAGPLLADEGEVVAVGRIRRLGVGAGRVLGQVDRLVAVDRDDPDVGVGRPGHVLERLGGEGQLVAVGRERVVGRPAERRRRGVDLELRRQVLRLARRDLDDEQVRPLAVVPLVPVADHQLVVNLDLRLCPCPSSRRARRSARGSCPGRPWPRRRCVRRSATRSARWRRPGAWSAGGPRRRRPAGARPGSSRPGSS